MSQRDSSSHFLPFIKGWLVVDEVIGDRELNMSAARYTDSGRVVAFYNNKPYRYSDDGQYFIPIE